MNTFGDKIKFTIFGQSHAQMIGVVIDGLRSGTAIDEDYISNIMALRAPGVSNLTSKRKEIDKVEFVSGVLNGKTVGTSICAIIQNTDMRSKDYSYLNNMPRPSHADMPAMIKYGENFDIRGGGQFSGRLTAPICIAGAIALNLLEKKNIKISTHIYSIGNIEDKAFSPIDDENILMDELSKMPFAVIDKNQGEKMKNLVEETALKSDSIGGIIECKITGLPIGIGNPMFEGIENEISKIIFGIPAVKGIEFGIGFEGKALYGSQYNDCYYYDENKNIKTYTNNNGGICGGMSTGMPIVFRTFIKPTPSIGIEQKTIDLSKKENAVIEIKGRHDPCIAIRANVVVRCAVAFAILNMIYDEYDDIEKNMKK